MPVVVREGLSPTLLRFIRISKASVHRSTGVRPVSGNWFAKWFAKYNPAGACNRGLIGPNGPPRRDSAVARDAFAGAGRDTRRAGKRVYPRLPRHLTISERWVRGEAMTIRFAMLALACLLSGSAGSPVAIERDARSNYRKPICQKCQSSSS
jgi:hypothetical protein